MPATPPEEEEEEEEEMVANAVVNLVRALPLTTQREIVRLLQCSSPSSTLMSLLQKRHIVAWHGLTCFTLRVLLQMSAELDDTRVTQFVNIIHKWWMEQRSTMSHVQMRPPSRLTCRTKKKSRS